MKVSELEGPELDYWVAKAEGLDAVLAFGMCQVLICADSDSKCYSERRYHDSWVNGGPLIQNNFIELAWNGDPSQCKASWMHNNGVYTWQFGPDALTAAMRCYIAAIFGEEVDDRQAHHI